MKLAYTTEAFWQSHAPYASASKLAKRYPPEMGGLTRTGWTAVIAAAKNQYPHMDWLTPIRGKHVPDPAVWPAPLYADETPPPPSKTYPTTIEIMADGSQRSDRLIAMSEEDSKDKDFVLRAHGFCPSEWEVVNARSSMWNQQDGEEGLATLYASKVTVRPIQEQFDLATVVEAVKSMEPRTYTALSTNPGLLEIPIVDAHFGVAPDGCYDDTVSRIIRHVERGWKQIVIPVGQDLFHNDNLQGTTTSGTVVDKIDFPKAWQQAFQFYQPIISRSLEHADEVFLYSVPGNHDESMSLLFTYLLQNAFPQLTCDLSTSQRKVHRYENVAIGWTHGHKSVKDFDRIFNAEFEEFRTATVKEVHISHKHHEECKDIFGVMVRRLPTKNPPDQWHQDEGYIGANRRFQLFKYSESALEAVRYV